MFSISHIPTHYALVSIIMLLNPLLHGAEKPAREPKAEKEVLFEHEETIKYMELSPDSSVLVVGGENKPPVAYTDKIKKKLVYGYLSANKIYNIPDEIIILCTKYFISPPVNIIGISSAVKQFLWAPTANSFAYEDTDGKIGIYDFTTCSSQFPKGGKIGARTMCWSPQSLFFAAAGKNYVYIWDTKNLSKEPYSIKYDQADSISFCDEDTIAIAGEHNYAETYLYKEPKKPSNQLSTLDCAVKYTHCKGDFLISTNQMEADLWEISKNKNDIIPVNEEHVYDMVFIAFLASYEYLLFASFHTLSISKRNGETVKMYKENQSILSVSCSHDEKRIAYGIADSTICVFLPDKDLPEWDISLKEDDKDVFDSSDIKLQWDRYNNLYATNDHKVYLITIT